MTLSPSQNVEVNTVVKMKCDVDQTELAPVFVAFYKNTQSLCSLEFEDGTCKNTSDACLSKFSASCTGVRNYSIQFPVPFAWNEHGLWCKTIYSESDKVFLSVTGLLNLL